MRLEDEADPAADPGVVGRGHVEQLHPEDLQTPLLEAPEAADEGQQGRLAGARLAHHDHDLAGIEVQIIVLQDHGARLTLPERVAHVADPDPRSGTRSGLGSREGPGTGCHAVGRHRKSSAGSTEKSFRTASWAETMHMTRVSNRTTRTQPGCIFRGSPVALSNRR